ncbi:MAG: aminotransferase class I/II-fold pyridoxal phosphate-dependent enzyme [Clostridiales Family XIII bacterium]|jgi:aspartate/methionine/tyrosine aminotransferase|nr:aminotransferase class I/II-fold pyridoxal phosphate-dependent enzyme [Clostridiales Family XIII bacterium]
MSEWKNLTKSELLEMKSAYDKKYEEFKGLGLKLDMSRGKPSPDLLDLSVGLIDAPPTWTAEDGTDARNYGVLNGVAECRRVFGDLLGIPEDLIIAGNNASLELMYNAYMRLYCFGSLGSKPWKDLPNVKFLCPSPGYDRHFAISQAFGTEMITVPMTADGPDMDVVETLARNDASVKGIWCVPLYSNPQGVVYSDETVRRLAQMPVAADDFRIFWDNAYGVHHIFEEHEIADIFEYAKAVGNWDRIYYFFSTSKVTLPGGGTGMMAASPANVAEQLRHMSIQTIGPDKLDQLRMAHYLKNAEGIRTRMRMLGALLRPKFEIVLDILERELGGTGLVSYIKPKGGYFIAIDTLEGCAKAVVAMAKEAGATLTGAGATYPYGRDPRDTNIRIAPTYPSTEELGKAMELLCLCVKRVSLEKLLAEK